jgi:hypothetical protein
VSNGANQQASSFYNICTIKQALLRIPQLIISIVDNYLVFSLVILNIILCLQRNLKAHPIWKALWPSENVGPELTCQTAGDFWAKTSTLLMNRAEIAKLRSPRLSIEWSTIWRPGCTIASSFYLPTRRCDCVEHRLNLIQSRRNYQSGRREGIKLHGGKGMSYRIDSCKIFQAKRLITCYTFR